MQTHTKSETIIPVREIKDPKPPIDDHANFSDWLYRRFIRQDTDLDFVKRLSLILKRDGENHLLPEARAVGRENRGIAIIGPSGAGKSSLLLNVLTRYLGEDIGKNGIGQKALYYRFHGDATIKSGALSICGACGFPDGRKTITRHEAQNLMVHRLGLSGFSVLCIDEIHNLLRKKAEPSDLFLKGLVQDTHGLAVIIVGTGELKDFLDDPKNIEVSRRYIRVYLDPSEGGEVAPVIHTALEQYCGAAELSIADDISADPHFALRLFNAAGGMFGSCMFLIATTVLRARECGASTVTRQHFSDVQDMLQTDPAIANPFLIEDYSPMAELRQNASGPDLLFADMVNDAVMDAAPAKKGRGRPSKKQAAK